VSREESTKRPVLVPEDEEEHQGMTMRGFFDLQTPEDLLHKLEREYAQLQQNPEDVDLAYNFFITAENMPEWVKGGGRKGKAFKHKIQQQEIVLIIGHELATGAKHVSSGSQRPAVRAATREGWVASGWVAPGWVAAPLIVRLSPEQATAVGQEAVNMLELASRVLAFWQQYLRGPSMPRPPGEEARLIALGEHGVETAEIAQRTGMIQS
jgi:hypothetical protein